MPPYRRYIFVVLDSACVFFFAPLGSFHSSFDQNIPCCCPCYDGGAVGVLLSNFWEHVSRHYDSPLDFSEVLKLPRIVLLILAGSSICERQFSAYIRMHTAERANLNVTTTSSAFAINSYGP